MGGGSFSKDGQNASHMSVAPSLPFCPSTTTSSTADAGSQAFGLGQLLGLDNAAAASSGSFGSLLNQGSVQANVKAAEPFTALMVPTGIPLTAGCVAQVAAQAGAQVPPDTQPGTLSPQVTTVAQQALPGMTQASTPAKGSTKPLAAAGTALHNGVTLPAALSASQATAGEGTLLTTTLGSKTPEEQSADQDQGLSAGLGSKDEQDSPQSAAASLSNAELAALLMQPQVPVQSPGPQGELSPETGAVEDVSSATDHPSAAWTPLLSTGVTAQAPTSTTQEATPQTSLAAPRIQVESAPHNPTTVTAPSAGFTSTGPVVCNTKALMAYEAGLQQDSAAQAQPIPAATPALQAAPALRSAAEAAVATAPGLSASSTAQATPVTTPFSMESSAKTPADATDGNAKDGTQAAPRAGDSTRISTRANSAALAASPTQGLAQASEKKTQSADERGDASTVKTDGIRHAKSDASMSSNRRIRSSDTLGEESLPQATSAASMPRTESVSPSARAAATESAQRTVATVSELVDRMQSRPATKVAIDVPLNDDQNVSVKLEYKAGVLHVNFRTDNSELRNALSREWSAVAAQSDSALRFAEPSFGSSSQDHSQQQSKADAFDMGWSRQGQQQQQQRAQQQEEAPRSFSLPGARGTNTSSATDGVSNRDRTTAVRQVAPDTTRHLNVVA